jgi:DNA-binding XRE family transcriptional regulator
MGGNMATKEKIGKKTKEALKGGLVPLKTSVVLTPGKALKIYRELQSLSQSDLAEKSGLKQATISALEHDRITLGLDRAKALARALKVHPSALAFPDWRNESEFAT